MSHDYNSILKVNKVRPLLHHLPSFIIINHHHCIAIIYCPIDIMACNLISYVILGCSEKNDRNWATFIVENKLVARVCILWSCSV